MVQKAKANDASLLELPWGRIVADIVAKSWCSDLQC